jgi:hypothetical protein
MSRLTPRRPFALLSPASARPARRPTHALHGMMSCFGLVMLAGLAGCNSRGGRPDAEVARCVEREDRRFAGTTAVAAADLTPLGIVSDAAWIEAVALLAVRPEPPAPEPEPVGRAEGWHYDAPASWGIQPWSFAQVDPGESSELHRSSGRRAEGALAIEGGGEEGDKGKLKLRYDFLRLRIKDRPVSISGSLKGVKSVQLKATIKL